MDGDYVFEQLNILGNGRLETAWCQWGNIGEWFPGDVGKSRKLPKSTVSVLDERDILGF